MEQRGLSQLKGSCTKEMDTPKIEGQRGKGGAPPNDRGLLMLWRQRKSFWRKRERGGKFCKKSKMVAEC